VDYFFQNVEIKFQLIPYGSSIWNLNKIYFHFYLFNFYLKKFNSYIILRFYDTETDSEEYPSISTEQAKKLAKFIWKHRNEKFVIHCGAGISRSAGVGLAIECIVKHNGNKFEFETSPCKIKEIPRYYPNLFVFNRICEEFNKLVNNKEIL